MRNLYLLALLFAASPVYAQSSYNPVPYDPAPTIQPEPQQQTGWQPLGGTPLSPPSPDMPPPYGVTPPLGGTDLRGSDIR